MPNTVKGFFFGRKLALSEKVSLACERNYVNVNLCNELSPLL